MTDRNHRILLARRPEGMPQPTDFTVDEVPIPHIEEGEILVRNLYLSIDPAIRGFLDDRPSYLPPVALGAPVRGMTLGRVVRSRRADMPEGSFVRMLAAWEDYSVAAPDTLGLERVEPDPRVPLSAYMGALGPAGLTAYVGLHAIGQVKAGETVVVSAAAGAVGSVAGQIARLRGCRVVGIVGSTDKARMIRDLGYDEAINYREMPDLGAAVHAVCAYGVDVYFDNVGGATLDALLPEMAEHGRIVVCGMIADYNRQDTPHPIRNLWQMVVKRLTMRGFLTYDHADILAEAQQALVDWVVSGVLRPTENIAEGLAAAPEAFIRLMSGATSGKTLVRLDPAA